MSKPRKFDNTKVIQRGKNESMKLLVFMIFALTIVITPAFAEIDLSNEKIASTDDNLIIQFADNTIRHFGSQTEITPNIENGIVDLGNMELSLDGARVNVLGDSFTIKNDYMSLYAKNMGNDKFRVNVYIFTNSGLQKTTFTANIIPSEPTVYVAPEIVIEEPTIQLFTWTTSPVLIGEELAVQLRVTDDEDNRGLEIARGGIFGADITIVTGQNGQTLITKEGTTNLYGVYNTGITLISGVYEHRDWLDVTIIAQWNDQYVSEQHRVWITATEGG